MTIYGRNSVRLSVRSRFDYIEVSSKVFPSEADATAHLAENPLGDELEADIDAVGDEPEHVEFL